MAGFDLGDYPVRVARMPGQAGQQVAAPGFQLRFAGVLGTGYAGSGRAKAAVDLGVTDLSTWEAFESVVTRLTTALTALTELMAHRLSRQDPSTDSSASG